jgi:hypothetical protein
MSSDLTIFNQLYSQYIKQCNGELITDECVVMYSKLAATRPDTMNLGGNPESLEQIQESNLRIRHDLDRKMRELYNAPSSIKYERHVEFEQTIYINILATILVTSLLYYTFTKL